MGSSQSKNRDDEVKRRKDLEWKHGVLIPPTFGVGTDPSLLNGVSICSKTSLIPTKPSRIEFITKTLPSKTLLIEHMTPGFWLLSTTPSSKGSVLASCIPTSSSSQNIDSSISSSSSSQYLGTMSASQTFHNNQAQISLQATTHSVPGLNASVNLASDRAQLHGSIDTNGLGWLGCFIQQPITLPSSFLSTSTNNSKLNNETSNVLYYKNDPFTDKPKNNSNKNNNNNKRNDHKVPKIHIRTWIEGKLNYFGTQNSNQSSIHDTNQLWNIHASTEMKGGIFAIEMNMPMNQLMKQQPSPKIISNNISYLASFDLNSYTTDHGPPLMVSLHKDHNSSSMGLSQIFSFDRYVYNLFEERTSKIRNTIGWSFQWEKMHHQNAAHVSAGCAWQINRGACIKVVAKPHQKQNELTAAVLFKRWKDPNFTCSLQFGATPSGSFAFKGIGLELETGPTLWQNKQPYYMKQNLPHTNNEQTPATKILVTGPNIAFKTSHNHNNHTK